jgi:hypothetical protein
MDAGPLILSYSLPVLKAKLRGYSARYETQTNHMV